MTTADDVIGYASTALGRPYVYGDEGPTTFDCSGLTQWAFGLAGIRLPRTAEEQQRFTKPVTNPMPGDLVFWGTPAYHMGLYIGGGKMIAAPSSGDVVKIQNVWGTPSGYGRVPGIGIGQALAPAIGAVGAVTDTVATKAADWLGPVRFTALEALAVLAGVGLVGAGIVRTVVPQVKSKVEGMI